MDAPLLHLFLAVSHIILRPLLSAVSSNFLSRRTTTKFAPNLRAPTFCVIIKSSQAIITTTSSQVSGLFMSRSTWSSLSTFGLVPDVLCCLRRAVKKQCLVHLPWLNLASFRFFHPACSLVDILSASAIISSIIFTPSRTTSKKKKIAKVRHLF